MKQVQSFLLLAAVACLLFGCVSCGYSTRASECVSDFSLSNRKTYHAAFTGAHVLLYDADYNLLTVL